MKHRSATKSEIPRVKLYPVDIMARNPVAARINDCEIIKLNKWRNWTEPCMTLPVLRSTILAKQISVTIYNFDVSYCSTQQIKPWR